MNKLVRLHFFGSTLFLILCFLLQIFNPSYGIFPGFNFLLFLLLFFSTIFSPLFSLKLLVFFLPFAAGISEQLKAVFNLNLFALDPLIIDASIGWLSGIFLLDFFIKPKSSQEKTSGRIQILEILLLSFHLLILITVAIAISRNLYQAASPYSVKGFFYNLTNIRIISWYDDYFPLKELLVFTTVITLSLRLLRIVRTKSQLIGSVLSPLFAATVIVLCYALWSKFTGIGYFRDPITFGANSFLSDLHAFGGYALAAFVGSLYYLTSSQKKVKLIASGFSLLAASGVLVSGSRFSIGVLVLILLAYLLFYSFNRPEKRLLIFILITLITVIAAFSLKFLGDRSLIQNIALLSKAKSLEDINIALSYRPEIFRSALLMYSYYPILGLGKGIFYRQSSINEFSNSAFFSSLNNGENAHNYFLQILAETGLIGLSLFCAIFICHALYLRNHHNQIISVLIVGIFLGNLYGHSLLVPNILALLFILLGSLNVEGVEEKIIKFKFVGYLRYLSIVAAIILATTAVNEVKLSYGKLPFQQRFGCYKKAYYADNHTDGLFEKVYPVTGKSFKIEYSVYHPDTPRRSLKIDFNIYQGNRTIAQYNRIIKSPGKYEDILGVSQVTPGSNILLQIKTSRCFTPINLGFSRDNRRLGIQLNQVVQN